MSAQRGPNPELGLAILRVVLGVVFISHGAPRLFAAGVGEFTGMLGGMGVPLAGFLAWVVTLLEFFGGIALVAGFMVTPLAILFVVHMFTGIVLVHAPIGWYVVGPGQGGAEFNTLLIAGLLALLLAGPGAAAVDARRSEPELEPAGPAEGGSS